MAVTNERTGASPSHATSARLPESSLGPPSCDSPPDIHIHSARTPAGTSVSHTASRGGASPATRLLLFATSFSAHCTLRARAALLSPRSAPSHLDLPPPRIQERRGQRHNRLLLLVSSGSRRRLYIQVPTSQRAAHSWRGAAQDNTADSDARKIAGGARVDGAHVDTEKNCWCGRAHRKKAAARREVPGAGMVIGWGAAGTSTLFMHMRRAHAGTKKRRGYGQERYSTETVRDAERGCAVRRLARHDVADKCARVAGCLSAIRTSRTRQGRGTVRDGRSLHLALRTLEARERTCAQPTPTNRLTRSLDMYLKASRIPSHLARRSALEVKAPDEKKGSGPVLLLFHELVAHIPTKWIIPRLRLHCQQIREFVQIHPGGYRGMWSGVAPAPGGFSRWLVPFPLVIIAVSFSSGGPGDAEFSFARLIFSLRYSAPRVSWEMKVDLADPIAPAEAAPPPVVSVSALVAPSVVLEEKSSRSQYKSERQKTQTQCSKVRIRGPILKKKRLLPTASVDEKFCSVLSVSSVVVVGLVVGVVVIFLAVVVVGSRRHRRHQFMVGNIWLTTDSSGKMKPTSLRWGVNNARMQMQKNIEGWLRHALIGAVFQCLEVDLKVARL
ncbi:hypothetical protein K438DRAFT_1775665 [Mycena galopus ATCC 62051]|nr:hypothetical protein K438DRAFT_1775665 [Mycena galopus ATCC 62051]